MVGVPDGESSSVSRSASRSITEAAAVNQRRRKAVSITWPAPVDDASLISPALLNLAQAPQHRAGVLTGASQSRSISSSTWHRDTDAPAMSSDVT